MCTIEVELSFDLVKSSNFEWDSDVSDFRMDRQWKGPECRLIPAGIQPESSRKSMVIIKTVIQERIGIIVEHSANSTTR